MRLTITALSLFLFFTATLASGDASKAGDPKSGPSPRAQAGGSGKRCTTVSLKGAYGYSYTGTVEGFGGIAAVGPINFDGQGNTSATYSVNLGGTNFQGSFTGTYTVNEDCTGSITINLPLLGTSSSGRFIVVENGKEALFMGTDAGVTVTGVAKRL